MMNYAFLDRFCSPHLDRLQTLLSFLDELKLSYSIIPLGDYKFIQVASGRPGLVENNELVLCAHYDRYPGSPGANDNASGVFCLLNYLSQRRQKIPFRVVFTDGEEVLPPKVSQDQGAHFLGQFWASQNRIPFMVVLDMVGIGDTFVLGNLGQTLRLKVGVEPQEKEKKFRSWMHGVLRDCGVGQICEINTPFSDDLGFLMAKIPALQISLLPYKQAMVYRTQRLKPGEIASNHESVQSLPKAWQTMHTPEDKPQGIQPQTEKRMEHFLARLEALWPLFSV